VAPSAQAYYNFHSVSAFLKTIGVEYTPADKDEVVTPPLRELCTLQFLKMRTVRYEICRFEGVRFMAAPDIKDVLPSLKWVSNSMDPREALVCNANDILKRLWGVRQDDWTKFRLLLMEALGSVGVKDVLIDWAACEAMWLHGEYLDPNYDFDIANNFVRWCPPIRSVGCKMFAAFAPRTFDVFTVRSQLPYIVVPEMDNIPLGQAVAAANAPVGDNIMSNVSVVSPVSQKVRDTRSYESNSVVELLKRFGGFTGSIATFRTPVDRMFLRDNVLAGAAVRPGLLNYYSTIFRYWKGDVRFLVSSNSGSTWRFNFCNELPIYPGAEFTSTELWTSAPSRMCLSGPGAYSSLQNGSSIPLQIPFVSEFKMLLIPRGTAENETNRSNIGYMTLELTGGSGTGNVLCAGGDNMRFGYLYEVPTVRFLAAPALGVLKPEMMGITFDEVEPLGETSGGRPVMSVDENRMAEKQITYQDIAERWQLLNTGVWATTDASNALLIDYEAPWDMIFGQNVSAFNAFMFFRGDILMRIELQSQPFQQGVLIAFFAPETTSARIGNSIAGSRTSQTLLPHVKISAGAARSVVFRIPFVHHKDRLNIVTGNVVDNIMGSMHLRVFNVLRVGVGAIQTSAVWSIFVSFPKADFQIMRPAALPREPQREEEKGYTIVHRPRFRNGGRVYVEGGVMSVASGVMDVVGESVDFVRGVVKQGAILANKLDYPNVAINPAPMQNLGAFDIALGTNQAFGGRVLDITPRRGDIMTYADVQTPCDEMLFSCLLEKPTYWESFEWTAGDAVGQQLYEDFITISPGATSTLINVSFQPTLMEFVALPFNFWKGDLVVKIEVIGTQFHSGKLAFVTRYGDYALGVVTVFEALSQYAHIIDVAGGNMEFEFVIPWRSDREMLRVSHHAGLTPLSDYVAGVWQIVVVNPLQYNGVSDAVQVNVYLSMRQGKLEFPGNSISRIRVDDPYL
jgi:hypothetical protein